jgi:hypothetical protein
MRLAHPRFPNRWIWGIFRWIDHSKESYAFAMYALLHAIISMPCHLTLLAEYRLLTQTNGQTREPVTPSDYSDATKILQSMFLLKNLSNEFANI